jgi:hypothetical protein
MEIQELIEKVRSSLTRSEISRPTNLGADSNILLDDTTGWNNLESNLEQLHQIIFREESMKLFDNFQDNIWDIVISQTSVHINRHVRHITHVFIEHLVETHLSMIKRKMYDKSILNQLDHRIVSALCEGLADNWSEMRLVACHSSRAYLLSLTEDEQSNYWPDLLPRLCLNRFYSAEGVQVYSLDTWKLVIKTRGKLLIAQHIKSMVDHYVHMSKAKNHMVCEAACHAMAELASKINTAIVVPYAQDIIEALKDCILEPSWPVRDAATVATGLLLKHIPSEISLEHANIIIKVWIEQLKDSIWSVRENAAIAFGDSLLTSSAIYRRIIWDNMEEHLNKYIDAARSELSVEDTKKPKISSFLPPEMLIKKDRSIRKSEIENYLTPGDVDQNNITTNSNHNSNELIHEMSNIPLSSSSSSFSSSSRAGTTKNWHTRGWGCCLDCVDERKNSPWEASAGCIILVRELLKALLELSHDTNPTSPSKDEYDLWNVMVGSISGYLVKIWDLLEVTHFREAEKLHIIVLQQVLIK